MTPENKIKAKEKIVEYLKENHKEYPEIDPVIVVQNISNIYKILADEQIIKVEEVPFEHFQHIILDQYRNAMIMEQLSNFF